MVIGQDKGQTAAGVCTKDVRSMSFDLLKGALPFLFLDIFKENIAF